jgi:hypothetical protein
LALSKVIGAKIQRRAEDSLLAARDRFFRADEAELRRFVRSLRKERPNLSDSLILSALRITREKIANGDVGNISDRGIEELIVKRINSLDSGDDDAERKSYSVVQPKIEQRLQAESFKDFCDLGVRGLQAEHPLLLPRHLWKGRYLMLKFPDLLAPDLRGEFVNRPCAVWGAFAKISESGRPVLAGLELHPVSRDQTELFSAKMPVAPIRTMSKKTSYLGVDYLFRLPLEPEFFQTYFSCFFELMPEAIDSFEARRNEFQGKGQDFKILGLQDTPENWVRLDLPAPPDQAFRNQLIGVFGVRFAGKNPTRPQNGKSSRSFAGTGQNRRATIEPK